MRLAVPVGDALAGGLLALLRVLAAAAFRMASRCASGSRLATAFKAASRRDSAPLVAAALRDRSLRLRRASSVSVITPSPRLSPLRLSPSSTRASHGRRASASAASSRPAPEPAWRSSTS